MAANAQLYWSIPLSSSCVVVFVRHGLWCPVSSRSYSCQRYTYSFAWTLRNSIRWHDDDDGAELASFLGFSAVIVLSQWREVVKRLRFEKREDCGYFNLYRRANWNRDDVGHCSYILVCDMINHFSKNNWNKLHLVLNLDLLRIVLNILINN